MRVSVNERCQGHTQCVFTAPQIFDLDEQGRAFVVIGDVPAELWDLAWLAAESCPERAVDVEHQT